MSWQCPYATKMKGVQGLGCKKIMKDDVETVNMKHEKQKIKHDVKN